MLGRPTANRGKGPDNVVGPALALADEGSPILSEGFWQDERADSLGGADVVDSSRNLRDWREQPVALS